MQALTYWGKSFFPLTYWGKIPSMLGFEAAGLSEDAGIGAAEFRGSRLDFKVSCGFGLWIWLGLGLQDVLGVGVEVG